MRRYVTLALGLFLASAAAADAQPPRDSLPPPPSDGNGPYVYASHILFAADAAAEADRVKRLIETGLLSFAEAARQYSQDSSTRDQGGEIRHWAGPGFWVAPFDSAAFRAPVGTVVGPIRTQFGLHLLRVEARTDPGGRLVRHALTPPPPPTAQDPSEPTSPTRSDVIGAPAPPPPAALRTGRDRAVFFATDNYEDDTFSDLVNPIHAAEAIAAELRERYGFETEVVRNPTRQEVYAALDRYRRGPRGEDDQLLVFFAGHGTYDGDDDYGRGFMIPRDGRAGSRSTWISYSDLADELDLLPVHRLLLVLDVCFGGSFIERGRSGDDLYGTATPAEIVGRYGRYSARLALTSGAREYVSDGRPGRHSPFAYHLLRALRSEGGPNADGLLLFEELVGYVREVRGPTPLDGWFGRNEAGSNFFLVPRGSR